MKKELGPVNALYPSLTTILGAVVDGKPTFVTIAHVGILNHGTPQYISFGVSKTHYTNQGVIEHGEFSVNIPGEDLMVETDYAGLVSGKNTDKSGLFETFTGKLQYAPMIKRCPVCMECRLHETLDFKTHDIFVGEIKATYADASVLTEGGKIDPLLAKPMLFDMATVKYYAVGRELGGCWNAGKALKRAGGVR